MTILSERWLNLWYKFLYVPATWLAILCFSMRTRGRWNVPQTGPFLVIANHQSALDPVLLALAMQRPARYLARRTLFRSRLLGGLITICGAIPINHDMSGKDGLKTGLEVLKTGNGLLIFPEGTRTRDGSIGPFKPGVLLLIKRSQAPIVLVAVAGAYEAMPPRSWFPRLCPLFLPPTRSSISCIVGKPIPPAELEGMSNDQMLEFLHQRLVDLRAEAEALRRR